MCIYPSQREAEERLSYVLKLLSHVIYVGVIATHSIVLMYSLCRPGSSWVLSLVYLQTPCMSWDYFPPIRQTPPICIVMLYVTPRKLPCIAANYFFWLATATLGVLPTVAPVCMGASGMGTSLKSSWPIALMVYVSVASN